MKRKENGRDAETKKRTEKGRGDRSKEGKKRKDRR